MTEPNLEQVYTTILLVIAICGGIYGIYKYIFKRGKDKGTMQTCLEVMAADIVEVKADLKTHLDQVPVLIKANDQAHNDLDKKIIKLEKYIVWICVKLDPNFKPEFE